MSMPTDAPALIQYACERCKTRFVLPPSNRKLGPIGRVKATVTAIGRTFRDHEGYSVAYDGVRRQMLAKMDDDAYQSFVQSFKFCHECRQFVCSECWSNSRKTCLGCFAKAAGTPAGKQKPAYAPQGPSVPRPEPRFVTSRKRRHVSTQASLLVMAAAVLLLVVELAIALPGSGAARESSPSAPVAGVTQTDGVSPGPSGTADATATETATPTATPTSTPSSSPTESPSPTSTPTPAPTPTPRPPTPKPPTPKPTPTPTPAFPTPSIKCNGSVGPLVYTEETSVTCVWQNNPGGATGQWWYGSGTVGGPTADPYTLVFTPPDTVQIKFVAGGKTSNTVTIWDGGG